MVNAFGAADYRLLMFCLHCNVKAATGDVHGIPRIGIRTELKQASSHHRVDAGEPQEIEIVVWLYVVKFSALRFVIRQ